MVAGVDSFLTRETSRIGQLRPGQWKRDFSSDIAFKQSIAPERTLLGRRLGVVDGRVVPHLQLQTNNHSSELTPFTISSPGSTITAVRWQVLYGLSAEGILLQPKGKVRARIVMIPDAGTTPEVLAGIQVH